MSFGFLHAVAAGLSFLGHSRTSNERSRDAGVHRCGSARMQCSIAAMLVLRPAPPGTARSSEGTMHYGVERCHNSSDPCASSMRGGVVCRDICAMLRDNLAVS